MQNWEHVLFIQESLNRPLSSLKNLHSDIMRVRHWYLDGDARHYRQTIVFASVYNDFNVTLLEEEKNFCGRVQVCGNIII